MIKAVENAHGESFDEPQAADQELNRLMGAPTG